MAAGPLEPLTDDQIPRKVEPSLMNHSRMFASLAAAGLLLSSATALALTSPAAAAPGNPGTPSAPVEIFHEDFENGLAADELAELQDYTAANGTTTYTADDYWLPPAGRCNGLIMSHDSGLPAPYSDCVGGQANWVGTAGAIMNILGQVDGASNADANHGVLEWTAGGDGANEIEFATDQPIPLPDSGRFISFSIDVASACQGNQPQLNFSLIDGSDTYPVTNAPISPCADGNPDSQSYPSGTAGSHLPIVAGSYFTDSSVLFQGTSLDVVMRNSGGSGANGNDHAFDNIRVFDATPQLDKQFVTSGDEPLAPLAITDLVFTITNTSERAEKTGWSFTDALADGLEVAGAASTTCDAATIDAPVGGQSVAVTGGSLGTGDTSCTITVPVTSWEGGAFENGPGDVTTVGLDEPGTTDVTYQTPAPGMTVEKSAELDDTNDNGLADVGEEINYSFTVENTGNVALNGVSIDDPKVSGLDPASADLAPGDVVVFTADPYVVTKGDVKDGSVDNTATATGDLPRSLDGSDTFSSDPDTVQVDANKPAGRSSAGLPGAGSPMSLSLLGTAVGSLVLGALLLVKRRRHAA